MRIWVDGQCFQTHSNVRGIGRYVADLLRALDASGKVKLIISLNGTLQEEAIAARAYLRRMVPGAEIAIWYGLTEWGENRTGYCPERMTDEKILNEHINQIAPDVALSPSPFEGAAERATPFIKTEGVNAITACIFHDAIPHRFPDIYLQDENARKCYYRRFEQIDKFDLVLCNSEFTASEYRDIFKKDNAVAIGAGLSETFMALLNERASAANELAASLGRYVLYVGGIDWRKNVPLLVRALSNVPECIAGDLKLVLAGYIHHEFHPIRDLWIEKGLNPANLISTGWISDAQLVDLYRQAAVTVQPSLMEGFGLTALEAMAAGSPFVSARAGAAIEVVGIDKLLFDPAAAPELGHLISRMLNDSSFRDQMIAYGLQRAKAFGWNLSATLTFNSLQQALQSISAPSIEAKLAIEEKPPARLILDVSSTVQSPVMSGIQRVMHRLSEAMQKLNETDPQKTVLSYCRDDRGWYALPKLDKHAVSLDPRDRLTFGENDTYFLLDSSWNFTGGQRRRLVDALVLGQEVVHGIHDIGPLTMSAMTDAGMPPAFRAWFEFVLGHSTGIICVSRAVADEVYDLIEAIELPRPMKIGYFRLGGDFADVTADDSWLSFLGGKPTFLMVGTIEPRKGHVVALGAFETLWAEGLDVNLLIVGKAGWDTRLLRERIAAHPEAEKRLFVRTGLSDGELQAAYEAATALIMTSYLEGFGLPVVEAGRLGCPVILSDIPVFREVALGAPAARFFRRADSADLARQVREIAMFGFGDLIDAQSDWPSWIGSAKEVKDVLFGGEWYRRYEPKEVLPNVRLTDIGNTHLSGPLSASQRAHTLRYVEGPLLSDCGREIRFAVSLRNDSDVIWSSYRQDASGLDINLGSHIYGANGVCLDYENPRTSIPFVLYPGQEIFLPVRIPTDWLIRNAKSVGIEIVQEGVSWFGEAMRLSLLQPPAVETQFSMAAPGALLPKLFRGPFGSDLESEQYYLFVVYNSSRGQVHFQNDLGQPQVSASLANSSGSNLSGAWIVNSYSEIRSAGYGFLCVYVSGVVAKSACSLLLRFEGEAVSEWRLDLKTYELECCSVGASDQLMALIPAIDIFENRSHQDDIYLGSNLCSRVDIDFTKGGTSVATRGFHRREDTHTWMEGRHGEIEIAPLVADVRNLRSLEIQCCAISDLPEPMNLDVYLGMQLLGSMIVSTAFMTYSLEVKTVVEMGDTQANMLLRLEANQSRIETDGERNLSVCLSRVSLSFLTCSPEVPSL